jgi:simple sugar transport system permease protein
VFGLGQSLAAGRSPEAQRSVVLTLAIGVTAVAVWLLVQAFRRRSDRRSGASDARHAFELLWPPVAVAAIAAVLFAYFATVERIPDSFVAAAPYLTTLLVLAFASSSLRPPAMAGVLWRRGQVG